MRRKLNRARLTKFGIIGAAAALAAGGVVAALPGASAQESHPTLPRLASKTGAHVPPGARKVAKFGAAAPFGKHGPAFETQVSNRSVGSRVVNGSPANTTDFPSVVGIESLTPNPDDPNSGLVWTCTGTVLSPTKVLTAAHCIVGLPNYGFTVVYAGLDTLPSDPTIAISSGFSTGVTRTWVDQSYNALAQSNGTASAPVEDVAVLTLATPLPSTYPAISLSALGDQSPYAEGTNATIAGYGDTIPGQYSAGSLYSATVPMVSDANCTTAFGTSYQSASMVCAGSVSATNSAPDSCFGDSGGPITVGGVEVGVTDWGKNVCGNSYGVYERLSHYHDLITADLTRPDIVNLDGTEDGHTDLIGRDAAGSLHVYAGTGFTGGGYHAFDTPDKVGTGWGSFNKLFRVTNWNGDGQESIMAELPNGNLYREDKFPDGLHETLVGTGWNAFSDIVVTNNWNGDNLPSLMARTRGGDLFIYNSDGHGGWSNPAGNLIGSGWGAFNTVLTPGNWLGNGHQVLLGRTPGGLLFEYEGNGHGGWLTGKGFQIGTGWNGFKIFQAPGDVNGDDMIDVIGITPGGAMFLYTTDGFGKWITGKGIPIGSGWQIFNTVF